MRVFDITLWAPPILDAMLIVTDRGRYLQCHAILFPESCMTIQIMSAKAHVNYIETTQTT